MIGVPFKLHGRNPAIGLDCVGLLIASLEAIGIRANRPFGYGLRNISINKWMPYAGQWGLRDVSGPVKAGDILLISPGPRQHHIQIADSCQSVIHAHAGLRRVVRQPVSRDLPPQAHWRLGD